MEKFTDLATSPTTIAEYYFNPVLSWREQHNFVQQALAESPLLAPIRPRSGPHVQLFTPFLQKINEKLQDLGLDATFLAERSYLSYAQNQYISRMQATDRDHFRYLKEQYHRTLRLIGCQKILPLVETQTLSPHLLTTPPYHFQGEHIHNNIGVAVKNCFNTAFRMVFDGITGCDLREDLLSNAIEVAHGRSLVVDDIYLQMFKTPHFRQLFDRDVTIATYIGTDFTHLNNVTTAIIQRRAASRVFCIVSLASDAPNIEGAWHAAVLLHADQHEVTYHDPASSPRGGAFKTARKAAFVQRWAATFNRAHLVITS